MICLMKQILQRCLGPFGYTIRRTASLVPFVPFIREFKFPGASFRMWITSDDVNHWYDPKILEESAEQQGFMELIRPGDRILEIGAHHGYTGMLLSRLVGDDGYVLGVEPFPGNFQVEHSQLALNPEIKNLTFINAACTRSAGTIKIEPIHNARIASSGTQSAIEVQAITGDSLDEKFGPFNVLKIDVEGHEVEVLQGCAKILSRLPRLNLELHLDLLPHLGHNLDEVFHLINIGKYHGTMIIRPKEADKLVPFDANALRLMKHNPDQKFLAANVFLEHA